MDNSNLRYNNVQCTTLSCIFTALDLQQCGVSNRGALAFQSLLRCNKSLVVVDLRINPLIGKSHLWRQKFYWGKIGAHILCLLFLWVYKFCIFYLYRERFGYVNYPTCSCQRWARRNGGIYIIYYSNCDFFMAIVTRKWNFSTDLQCKHCMVEVQLVTSI